MIPRHFYFVMVFGLLFCTDLQGQTLMSREVRLAVTETDSLWILDPWIAAESFSVKADSLVIDPDYWTLYPVRGHWIWHQPVEHRRAYDTLYFRYDVWPLDISPKLFERKRVPEDSEYLEDSVEQIHRITRPSVRQQDLFAGTDLQRSGSLRRGVIIGSAQDMTMESGLQLNVSGQITDEVSVVATLTDRSTPVQPDGTTQTLREFDQVYIRLEHEAGLLQMGDIDVKLDQSSFAVLERRLQGVDVQATFPGYGANRAAAAVSRGHYREMRFTGSDGVQGPYRLSGAENEAFIIVLAGTEQVFLNGIPMVRGEENDYVIDYGLGEITFTSRRIITDHTRIVVVFQYLRDAYTRTLLTAETAQMQRMGGRIDFGATVIREADNIRAHSGLFLTEQERKQLQLAGNDPARAVVSGADSVGFRRDADFLLYSLVDTLYSGEQYEIFRHLPGDSSGVWRVQFNRVPEGEGDYRRAGRAANGMVFEWVGPGMGNYMPERRLPMPSEQTMLALRSRIHISSGIGLFGEWAASHYDQNRFSGLDNRNNDDMSFMGGLEVTPFSTVLGTFSLKIAGRYEGEFFSRFDRFKEVEYDRKWNLGVRDEPGETLWEGSATWSPLTRTQLQLGAGNLERKGFEGRRVDLRVNSSEQGLPELDYFLERIVSEDLEISERGNWMRHRIRMAYGIPLPVGLLEPALHVEHEDRQQRDLASDSLRSSSLRFTEFGPGLAYLDGDRLRIGSSLLYRKDQMPGDGDMVPESSEITLRQELDFRSGSLLESRNMVGYRKRNFSSSGQPEKQRQDSRGILVRSVTDYRPLNRLIQSQFLYDVNTERRALFQETFVEVGPELGQYVWEDLNNDGVRQIDEFFPEQNPNEGTFIKYLVPSDELFSVISLRARLRSVIDFARWVDPYDARFSQWLDMLSGIRLQSVVDIREESATDNLKDIYFMRLSTFRNDSLTVQGRLFMEKELELFRNHPRRELRFHADRLRSKNRRASGLENLGADHFEVRSSGRITPVYRWTARAGILRKFNESEEFVTRNYFIRGLDIQPGIDMRWSASLQMGTGITWIFREDSHPDTHGMARGISGFVDARASHGLRWYSSFRLERRQFGLSGGPVSSLGQFELTDGAGPGTTWSWSVQSDYRISDFLRAGLQYHGRTVSDRPSIQTIRGTIQAVF